MNQRVIDRMGSKEVQERASAVRHRKVRGDFCVRDDYGSIREVRCRMCSTTIAGMAPVKTINRTLLDGKIKEEIMCEFRHYDNFIKLPMQIENGATYEPNMCKSCASTFDPHDEELIEACFCADIESWARGTEIDGKGPERFQNDLGEMARWKVRKGLTNGR